MNQWKGRGSCAYKYLIATWRNEEMNNQKPVIIFGKLYINVERKTLSLFYVCVCTWYAIDVTAFRLYSIYYVDRLFLLWLYVGRAQQTSPKIINIYTEWIIYAGFCILLVIHDCSSTFYFHGQFGWVRCACAGSCTVYTEQAN